MPETVRPSSTTSLVARALGAALGIATAPVFGVGSFLRGRRVLHPVGVVFDADLSVLRPTHLLLKDTILGEPGDHPAIVRLSRGLGIPVSVADVHGLAIRIPDAGGPGQPQDLLLVTVRTVRSGGAGICRTKSYGPIFSSVLTFGAPQGAIVMHATARQPMPDDATIEAGGGSHLAFDLTAGRPGADFAVVARLTLRSSRSVEADRTLCFSVANDCGGLHPVGALNTAREIAYRSSQFGRAWRDKLS